MKVKIVILSALVFQIIFALFILVLAPEPSGSIKVGLDQLRASAPSEAPTVLKTDEGRSILKTSGDFFAAALQGYWLQTKVTLLAVALNTSLLLCLYLFVCKWKKVSKQQRLVFPRLSGWLDGLE
jgi:hypothetical protein